MKAYFTGLLDIFILILFHTLPCCLSTSACWYCSVPLSLLLGGCEKWLDGTCDYSVVTHGFWYPSKKRSCLKHVIPVFEIKDRSVIFFVAADCHFLRISDKHCNLASSQSCWHLLEKSLFLLSFWCEKCNKKTKYCTLNCLYMKCHKFKGWCINHCSCAYVHVCVYLSTVQEVMLCRMSAVWVFQSPLGSSLICRVKYLSGEEAEPPVTQWMRSWRDSTSSWGTDNFLGGRGRSVDTDRRFEEAR